MKQVSGPRADATSATALEIQRAIARIYRRVRSETTDNRLGDTALAVLANVVKNGAQTPRDLSERERVTPPSMNQTVNTLQAAGLVSRASDPSDGRKVLVAATELGFALTAERRHAKQVWLASRLDELSARELEVLVEAARILNDMAAS